MDSSLLEGKDGKVLSLEDTLMMDRCESDGQILLSAKIWESVDVTACCELGSGHDIWTPPLEMAREAQTEL